MSMSDYDLEALLAYGEDPYGEAPYGDLTFNPLGLPQKTNSRGQLDVNAGFNAQQDLMQQLLDPQLAMILGALSGQPTLDYYGASATPYEPQVAFTPTLDSLRNSSDEVLRSVAADIDAGLTPYEIEATLRAQPDADPDVIENALRAAERGYDEAIDAQRSAAYSEADQANQMSPMQRWAMEAGLPPADALYGDEGYDFPIDVGYDEAPAWEGRLTNDLTSQLERLRRQAADERFDPTATPHGSVWQRPMTEEDWGALEQVAGSNVRRPESDSAPPSLDNVLLEPVGPYSDEALERAENDGWYRSATLTPPPMNRGPQGGWAGRSLDVFGGSDGPPSMDSPPQSEGSEGWAATALGGVFGGDRPAPREREQSRPLPRFNSERYRPRARARVVENRLQSTQRRSAERQQNSRDIWSHAFASRGRTPQGDAVANRMALIRQALGL